MEIILPKEVNMVIIGAFLEKYGAGYEPINTMISKQEIQDKAAIIDFMKKCDITHTSPEKERDILTGQVIHRPLFMQKFGEFMWRSDTIYYIEKYNLSIPDDFANEVRKALGKK